jgi:predicted DNA-binding transcriptional regulator YafY
MLGRIKKENPLYHSLIQLISAARLIAREGGTTVQEIAKNLDTTTRSAYRVIAALEELYYPLFKDEEHGGRLKLVNPGYPPAKWIPLPPVEFTLEDRMILDWLFESEGSKPGLAEPIRNLRRKIDLAGAMSGFALSPKESGAGPRTSHAKLLHSSTPGKATRLRNEAWLTEILRAVEEHRVCSVSYESRSSGVISTYPVNPLAAFDSEDSLYLYVELPSSGAIRILALERIHEFSVAKERFMPPAGFNAGERLGDPFGIVQGEATPVVLLFSEEQAPYVRERAWPESYQFIEREDGSLKMRFTTRGIYGLKRWILGWMDEVEVLEPESLRKEIIEAIEAMRGIYTEGD